MDFLDLGLSSHLCQTIKELGYQTPTPIQRQAIPFILRKQDVLASAQTGTGKTASFLLPLIQLLETTKGKARLSRAIILEPTRELATQVMQALSAFTKNSPLKGVLLVGGESMAEQQKLLTRGADILVATPGRLLDFVERGQLMLLGIQHIIIDEADRMMDMGFMPDVKRLMTALPDQKQTILFSATFPEEIKKLADAYLHNPQEVHVTPETRTAATIEQNVIFVESLQKRQAVRYLLDHFGQEAPSIIFCNRKKEIATLIASLKRHRYQAEELHGDLPQSKRNETLQKFKENQIKVLVASDVAARGLDVEKLGLVINYDVPHNPEDYVHRIGRTGRAGQDGHAFSLVMSNDQKLWHAVETFIQQKVNTFTLPTVSSSVRTGTKKTHPVKKVQKDPQEIKPDFNHPVIGFGDFIPAFMQRSVALESLSSGA